MPTSLSATLYLFAAGMFILGIRRLSKVRTAYGGNRLASVGMFLAVLITMFIVARGGGVNWLYIAIGLLVGTVVGAISAERVQMTAMPEMVALFNGFGGAASALVALSMYYRAISLHPGATFNMTASLGTIDIAITAVLSLIVGAVTFSGSMVAFFKLNGTVRGNHFTFAGRNILNGIMLFGSLAIGLVLALGSYPTGTAEVLFIVVLIVSLVLGVTGTSPIGGADMPVVISLLNSFSGVAASMAGFVVQNNLLIIAGSLVGASGLILSNIMCKAMNRTLGAVLFKAFGGDSGGDREGYTNVKEASPEEVAMMMDDISSCIVVPGYGLAVAQAQHTVKEMADLLEKKGVNVRYAIHPVAGRMPGHMNVLLAEADVPYDKLVEMDAINPDFKTTDLVIVLGANDVVNPAALDEPDSPVYGMPILMVQEARTVIIVKRSLASGFAGIKNRLFDNDNSIMVFGDAKKVLSEIVTELKAA
jgi:NAD(P) transhydrogenase subunit beta